MVAAGILVCQLKRLPAACFFNFGWRTSLSDARTHVSWLSANSMLELAP
jgi:hypothetical protein